MLKKIRNLTDKDKEKLCNINHKKYGTCYDCPLEIDENHCFKNLDLDKEVEVEDEIK